MAARAIESGLALVVLAALLIAGAAAPSWLAAIATLGLAKGLVALGLVVMMRGGLVSFGQGLVFCAGAYAAGLMMRFTGIGDALLLVLVGALAALVIGLIVGPLIAGYRGIFFATLTLALSMIAYGVLNKTYALGGSDGINLRLPSYFGWSPKDAAGAAYALYAFASILAVALASACRRYFQSLRGLLALAMRDNELRVEYLGASARSTASLNFMIAAVLGGIGGALSALALGHIDPDFAFWTTSGEFVFLAILGGYRSVGAVFLAALLLELVRSFSSRYFPNAWQMVLGIFLLLVILFLPEGLGSLLRRRPAAAASGVPPKRASEAAQ